MRRSTGFASTPVDFYAIRTTSRKSMPGFDASTLYLVMSAGITACTPVVILIAAAQKGKPPKV